MSNSSRLSDARAHVHARNLRARVKVHCKNYPGEFTEVTISTFLILREWRIPW